MKLSQFNFELPEELVAQYPAPNRDEARLMVVHRDTGTIEHKVFKDIIYYFDEHDTMIFNNTKVFPARMYGRKEKTGAKIEVFLLRELNTEMRLWDVLVDPARKIRVGNKLYFTDKEENEVLIKDFSKLGDLGLLMLTGQFIGEDGDMDVFLVGDFDKDAVQSLLNSKFEEKNLKFAIMTKEDFLYRITLKDKFVQDIFDNKKNIIFKKFTLFKIFNS